MNKSMLMAALMAAALVVSFSLATGERDPAIGLTSGPSGGSGEFVPKDAPDSRAVVWDNGMGYSALGTAQIDAAVPFESEPADDFMFDEDQPVSDVHWIGGYWNGPPDDGDFDWKVSFYADFGDGTKPGALIDSWVFPNANVNETFIATYFYSYSVNLPATLVFSADTKYWIAIQGIGNYPPQSGWATHTDVILLHECTFRSVYFEYPDWVNGSELWTDPTDMCFQLTYEFVIPPGVDLFETPNDSMTVESLFTAEPLPSDFFGPGSDPFDGVIYLQGSPLATIPPDTLGPTDVIWRRFEPAVLGDPGSADTVSIELIALSLTSTAPITVTYDGGQNPEDWQVDICLSSLMPPPSGFMIITRECDLGGSFSVHFDYAPYFLKATFTPVPGGPPVVMDPYRNYPGHVIQNGRWATFVPPPFSVYISTGPIVDTDCDGSPDTPILPSSGNFYPGITLEPCPPGPPICGGKVLTLLECLPPFPYIGHRMLPPQRTSPAVGACCLPSDSCILVDSVCCGDLAGTYKGDYTNCFPDPCLTCCNSDGIRGDANNDMAVNVVDLGYLVDYLFFLGPAPPCLEEGDINGDGAINVADLGHLVDYLFFAGPPPAPCP